jgi:hypothetical protein
MLHTARMRKMRRRILHVVRQATEVQRLAEGEAGGRPRSMPGASPMPPPLRGGEARDMVGLFNGRKSARVSSLLRLLRAGDSMAEIVRRRPTFG